MTTSVEQVRETVRSLLARGLTGQPVDALIAAGQGGHVTIGALTTPILGGGGGTTIDIAQPEGVINIGAQVCLIPVRIHVEAEVGIVVADDEVSQIIIGVDTENSQDGINQTTVVNEAVFNMRTDQGNSFAGMVSAWSAVTAALTTVPTLDIELARAQEIRNFGTAVAMNNVKFELLYEPKHPPLLVGGSNGMTLLLYWGGTVAMSAFAQVQFVTCPSSWVTGVDLL